MILKFYKQSMPLAPSTLVVWAILLGVSGWVTNNEAASGVPVLPVVEEWVQLLNSTKWLSVLVAFLVVYLEGRLINSITIEKELLGQKNKLPHLFYMLLFFGLSNHEQLHVIIFANLFFMLALREILNLQYPGTSPSSVYKSGFYLGCGALIFPLYLYFLPFLIICLIVLKHRKVREWIIVIFGSATPLLYLVIFSYFRDKDADLLIRFWDLLYFDPNQIISNLLGQKNQLFLSCYVALLFVLSIIATLQIYKSEISRHKYAKQSVLVFAGALLVIIPISGTMPYHAIGAPILAVLFSFFFSWVKKWWIGEILLYLWILIIGLYYSPYFLV